MCGPSGEEKQLQAQSQNFSTILQSAFNKNFANQQSVLSQLNASLTPILGGGINQQGFSPQELAAFNTQAINTNAAGYANAARAARTASAGQGGGGTSGLTSGVQQQINAAIASGFAGNLANQQLGITEANYSQGRQNYLMAEGALQGVAGQYGGAAESEGGQAINENQASFGQAQQIQQQRNALTKDIVGGITGIASGFLTGGLDDLRPGEGFGENVGNFFKGGFTGGAF